MKFAHVDMLFLIWVLPLTALIYVYGCRRRRHILASFAPARALADILPAGVERRRRWQGVLVLTALLLSILAMAGPQYGFQWQQIERRGIDIIIALDCSRSMLATDIQPHRLDRAKREIYDLLNMLEGDRVGLVAFSGSAFLQCPLTIDYQAFHLFLEVLTPDYLPMGGTDLTQALLTAQNAFGQETPAEKAVILITDGEHTGPDHPYETAQALGKAGIKLFCIGVGAGEGVPIPTGQGGFKKDDAGRIVLSKLDEPSLSRMALATGGSYVRSVAGDMDLDTIYRDQIRGHMETATVESDRKQVWADRFQWPLALAVLALLIQNGMALIKKPLMVLPPLLLLLSGGHAPVHAGPLQQGYKAYQQGDYQQALEQFIKGQLNDPQNPDILYDLGNTYYKNGDYDAAQDHFNQSLAHARPERKAQLHYNLGNTAFRQGRLQEAVEHYQAALKLAPEDLQARENLDFVQQRIQQQQKQQQEQQGAQDQREQQQQPSRQNRSDSQPQQPQDQKEPSPSSAGNKPEPPQPPQAGNDPDRGPQPPQKPEDRTDPADQSQGQTAPDRQKQPGDAAAGAQMLNRLKDQPGRAMMPDYQKREVDKDW